MKNFQASVQPLASGKRPYILAIFVATLLIYSALAFATARSASVINGSVGPQSTRNLFSGQWTAEFSRSRPGEIQFTFHQNTEDGGFNMSGGSLSLNELQGLTGEAASSSAKAIVNFSIVREAGTFACEGYFREGKGAGFWTLTINQSFVSAMRSRGYDRLSDEELLRAAVHNLTTKYVDDLKAAGYDHPKFQELYRAAVHQVTPQYIRELQAAGYEGLTIAELIRARNHQIDSAYIKEVRAMGFDKQPLEMLIRLRNHEITQDFINQMRSAGFEGLSIDELIRLKNHQITPEFVNDLKAEGFASISPEMAVRLKNHNVDRDFIRQVKARGFTNLSLEQLIRLRNRDVVK